MTMISEVVEVAAGVVVLDTVNLTPIQEDMSMDTCTYYSPVQMNLTLSSLPEAQQILQLKAQKIFSSLPPLLRVSSVAYRL